MRETDPRIFQERLKAEIRQSGMLTLLYCGLLLCATGEALLLLQRLFLQQHWAIYAAIFLLCLGSVCLIWALIWRLKLIRRLQNGGDNV